jgi:hypothetical protein
MSQLIWDCFSIQIVLVTFWEKRIKVMKINWQKLIMKIFFWLVLEFVFNLINIDKLADYSEFLLISKVTIQLQSESSLVG